MRKVLFILLNCLLIAGCSTTKTTHPLVYTHSTSSEYEILGTILVRSNTSVGYNTVFEEAKKQYPATDFVIDIMIDQHEITTSYNIIAQGFRLLFGSSMKSEQTRYEYTIRGTAIKYIRRNINGEVITTPTPSSTSSQSSPNVVNTIVTTVTNERNTPASSNNIPEQTRIIPSIEQNPIIATRAIIDTRTSANEIGYTVRAIVGNVQYQRNMGDPWNDVVIGDIFTANIRIRTMINSSLVLNDGSRIINIQGGREGRIDSLIAMSNR